MEVSEDIRYTPGNKEIYMLGKETIERMFGSAKEQHGFRYIQYVGNARTNMKAGRTFACMNLKELAKILDVRERQNNNLEFFYPLQEIWEFAFSKKEWCLVLERGSSTNFVCSLRRPEDVFFFEYFRKSRVRQ